jgi:hypothetical protein
MSEPAPNPPRPQQSKAARNERRKAAAATLNAIGVAALVAGLFQPIATGRAPSLVVSVAAFAAFVVFQVALHYVLARLED